MYEHLFETMEGDELDPLDMLNATWKIIATYVDIEVSTGEVQVVFTHRIEVHNIDDLITASIQPDELE